MINWQKKAKENGYRSVKKMILETFKRLQSIEGLEKELGVSRTVLLKKRKELGILTNHQGGSRKHPCPVREKLAGLSLADCIRMSPNELRLKTGGITLKQVKTFFSCSKENSNG